MAKDLEYMDEPPRVSVLMPVYNGERYLREAIEGILNQTFTDFEFIIIDDGSTDGTAAILDSYSDSRIQVIHLPHRGLTKSLQFGLQTARGEFFARQDADDISLPTRLERQVNFLQDHPEVAVVGIDMRQIDQDGNFLKWMRLPRDDRAIRSHLVKVSPFGHGSIMARRACLLAVGGYRSEFALTQDRDLWLRVAECYQMAILPEPLYLLRKHKASVSTTQRGLQRRFGDRARAYALERLQKGEDSLGYKLAYGCTQRPLGLKARHLFYWGQGLYLLGRRRMGLGFMLRALIHYPYDTVAWWHLLSTLLWRYPFRSLAQRLSTSESIAGHWLRQMYRTARGRVKGPVQ